MRNPRRGTVLSSSRRSVFRTAIRTGNVAWTLHFRGGHRSPVLRRTRYIARRAFAVAVGFYHLSAGTNTRARAVGATVAVLAVR
jgi:hypothetical protein